MMIECCVQDKKMVEGRNPAFSCSRGVGPFGEKAGFLAHSRIFVLYTGSSDKRRQGKFSNTPYIDRHFQVVSSLLSNMFSFQPRLV